MCVSCCSPCFQCFCCFLVTALWVDVVFALFEGVLQLYSMFALLENWIAEKTKRQKQKEALRKKNMCLPFVFCLFFSSFLSPFCMDLPISSWNLQKHLYSSSSNNLNHVQPFAGGKILEHISWIDENQCSKHPRNCNEQLTTYGPRWSTHSWSPLYINSHQHNSMYTFIIYIYIKMSHVSINVYTYRYNMIW